MKRNQLRKELLLCLIVCLCGCSKPDVSVVDDKSQVKTIVRYRAPGPAHLEIISWGTKVDGVRAATIKCKLLYAEGPWWDEFFGQADAKVYYDSNGNVASIKLHIRYTYELTSGVMVRTICIDWLANTNEEATVKVRTVDDLGVTCEP